MSKKSISRRKFLQATGAAAGAATLAGCAGDETEEATTTEATTTTETVEKEVYKPGSLAVEATGDYELEMELASSFHASLQMLAYSSFSVIPEGIVGDVEGYDGEMDYQTFATSEPIGSGPFEFENWTQGTEASVTAFDDYSGDVPNLDRVQWQVIEKDSPAFNYAMNRNADLFAIPTTQYDPELVSVEETDAEGRQLGTYGPVRNDATLNYVGVPTINTFYIGLNAKNVPRAVRHAIAYAMDQHEGVEQVFKGRGTPAYHYSPPSIYPGGTSAYDEHAEQNYPYGYGETRISDARQVMEDAGYDSDNTFEITATTISGNSAYQRVFTRLQSKLRQAHIEMDITEAEFGTIISQAISGSMEVFALGDGMEYPGPENFLRFLYGESPSGQFTRWGAEDSYHDQELRQTALDAWAENYAAEDSTSESEAEAFQTIEEVNWLSMQELPIVNPASQRFWHQDVDVNMYGVMENQTFTDLTLSR